MIFAPASSLLILVNNKQKVWMYIRRAKGLMTCLAISCLGSVCEVVLIFEIAILIMNKIGIISTYLWEVCRYQMTECEVLGSLEVAGQQAHAWLPLLCLRILPLIVSVAIEHQHCARKSKVHFSNALGRVI